ncbi:MAG: hypothetical protein O2944_08725 [Proteobacteria bacterium]|nr:hypothetical protein [Pseudomonadota bacterium]
MRMDLNRRQREMAALALLAVGLVVLLWPPFAWFEILLKPTASPWMSDKGIAGKTWLAWPVASASMVAASIFVLRGRTLFRAVILPTLLCTVFVAPFAVASYLVGFIFVFGEFISHMVAILIWSWVMYRLLRWILRKLFFDSIVWSGTLLEEGALFAILAVPQLLYQFGLMLDLKLSPVAFP